MLWRRVWRFLKKLKIELPYDPAISLLGISGQNYNSKRCMHSNLIAPIFTIAKTWNLPNVH